MYTIPYTEAVFLLTPLEGWSFFTAGCTYSPRVEIYEPVRGLPFLNTLNKTCHDPSTKEDAKIEAEARPNYGKEQDGKISEH